MENNIELKLLVDEVIKYLFEDEKRHFEEEEIPPSDHIYLKLLRLRELNGKINSTLI
jgi:hypothetical protein